MTKLKPRPRKDAYIGIRTTSKVKREADEAAFQANQSVSAWVEGLIVAALKKETTNAWARWAGEEVQNVPAK